MENIKVTLASGHVDRIDGTHSSISNGILYVDKVIKTTRTKSVGHLWWKKTTEVEDEYEVRVAIYAAGQWTSLVTEIAKSGKVSEELK